MNLSVGETAEYVKQLVFMHKQSYVIEILEQDLSAQQIEHAKKIAVMIYQLDN